MKSQQIVFRLSKPGMQHLVWDILDANDKGERQRSNRMCSNKLMTTKVKLEARC